MAVRRSLRKCVLVPYGMHVRGYIFFVIYRTLRGYNVCLFFLTKQYGLVSIALYAFVRELASVKLDEYFRSI